MDDLYLAKKGYTKFHCQPEMVEPLYLAGYEIYRFVEVRMTDKEIKEVAQAWEEYATN